MGVNILEDVRHSSVLYICKYFVVYPLNNRSLRAMHPLCNKPIWCLPVGVTVYANWFH